MILIIQYLVLDSWLMVHQRKLRNHELTAGPLHCLTAQVIPDEIGQAGCPNAKLVPDWSTDQVLPWAGRSDKGITVRVLDGDQLSKNHLIVVSWWFIVVG